MGLSPDEFEPYAYLSRTLKFWWVLALAAIVGGAIGFGIHRLRAPIYEATAVFTASIDFNRIDFANLPQATPAPYNFTQYDEDISLEMVRATLIQVEPQVLEFASQNGLALDAAALVDVATIERKNTYWEVRFRNGDPALAQKIVNFWAQTGYDALLAKQKANLLPVFIYFDLNHLADLPTSPTYFQTNSFVLAGGVIGLVLVLAALNLPLKKLYRGA